MRIGRVAAVAVLVGIVSQACSWPMVGGGPEHSGQVPVELQVGAANVAQLELGWRAGGLGNAAHLPVVADGVVFVGAGTEPTNTGGALLAFAAAGCDGNPTATCAPLWTAPVTGSVQTAPAVVDGVAYVVTTEPALLAFDAKGEVGCGGTPKTCTPLWRAPGAWSAPTVADGKVFVGTTDTIQVFDSKGTVGCGGSPKVCSPLWTSTALIGVPTYASPAVSGGVVFAVGVLGGLYAFDAAGSIGCGGSPVTCAPLWTAEVSEGSVGSPAVSDGRVFVSSESGTLYAFDAAGSTACGGSPTVCSPLWTASLPFGNNGAPAVANGVVYAAPFGQSALLAFDAAGVDGCSGTPVVCSPLRTYPTGGTPTTPAVANGVVYTAGLGPDRTVYAFDATAAGCSGTPLTCPPLWTDGTGDIMRGGPIIALGTVYGATNAGELLAWRLP